MSEVVPTEQTRGYVAGKTTAMQDVIEVILQHLLAGNNREELEHDLHALRKQLISHARDMRGDVHRARADISPQAKAASSYLNGRIDGVYDVVNAIKNSAENAAMDRTRGS